MKFVIEHLSKTLRKKVLRDIDFTFDEGKNLWAARETALEKTTLFNC